MAASNRAALVALALALVGTAAAGCAQATDDPGLDSLLRVAGAQFYRGAMPAPQDGPAIAAFNNSSNLIRPGMTAKPLSGVVPTNATAVALYLDGDPGYWIIEPGTPDPTALGELGFSAKLSFSPLLPAGKYRLIGRAVDQAGRFGPPSEADLATADMPVGATLLISLRWDVEADLDLRVTDPDGVEIDSHKINSWQPPAPGSPPDPNGYQSGGILDFDSNANCVIDGRRLENVYWTVAPPHGHYVVRVDTYSLCGLPLARWQVEAQLGGMPLGEAHGLGRDADTFMSHDQGAGILALQFDVP